MFQGYLKVTQSCDNAHNRSWVRCYLSIDPRSDAVCLHIVVKLTHTHKELACKQPRITQRTCCRVNSHPTQNELAGKQLRGRKIARKQLHHILRGDLWTFRGWWGMGGWFKLSMTVIYFCTLNIQDISFSALYDFLFLLYKGTYFRLV